MTWTNLHAQLAAQAFEAVLGRAEKGTVAYARCFTPDVVAFLADSPAFIPVDWEVYRVADGGDAIDHTITADQAVELRESKGPAILLLVDTEKAGAGMDGIYSAAREVDETTFFDKALALAGAAITRNRSGGLRRDAELAIRRARGFGGVRSISPWTQFDFLVRVADGQGHPGEWVHLLGLWPIQPTEPMAMDEALALSRMFVEQFLGSSVAGLSPLQRINSLNLLASDEQLRELESFLRSAATKPILDALEELAAHPQLWINVLKLASDAKSVQKIELRPWRTGRGRIAKWSGLTPDPANPANPPLFIMDSSAESSRQYSKLKVQWQVKPATLSKGAAQYRVQVLTDMGEELASREIPHSAKQYETCYFDNDDFMLLSEDSLIAAKVVVSVMGNTDVEAVESEEFKILFGEPPEHEPPSSATKVRSFVEGVIDLKSWEEVSELLSDSGPLPVDAKGFMLLRTTAPRRAFKVFRPPLIRQVEEQWTEENGAIGRWRVRVRVSGEQAAPPEFIPMGSHLLRDASGSGWDRLQSASRRLAKRFALSSGVAQIYDERSSAFSLIKEYMLAWTAVLDSGDPILALANTVEVQTLSGRTIGLIVLPSHPLRVAWHAAYDNLALYTRYEHGVAPNKIRQEFSFLDGAAFPAFLPGVADDTTFVFADTLGFHAVGMVLDTDKEPKAAMALLAKAMSGSTSAESAPTIGQQSAVILSKEIQKYVESHNMPQPLHIHALRPVDGLTVARALGCVRKVYSDSANQNEDETDALQPSFVLELYPSSRQRGLAGRFIAETREKRRRGAGVVAEQDRWMLESVTLPGGISRPLLRWARKDILNPENPAHIAIAFDTFESQVRATVSPAERPLFAYGLLSFFDRTYQNTPFSHWYGAIPTPTTGEKHPVDRFHTERLLRLQRAVEKAVAERLGDPSQTPALYTSISDEKAESLRKLHQLCDWVITLDRGAGVEYFDSPRDNRAIYEAYVIATVPEREDLGSLQLITSTSNLSEVQNLLRSTLDRMGLSYSRRNTQFLLDNLKAISGRLAIRLTGQNAPDSELIALALSHANCRCAHPDDPCWVSLDHGFIIPTDDVVDLIPPLTGRAKSKPVDEEASLQSRTRPDLIYVSTSRRKGLTFQFIEVKYRRHLRTARTPELLDRIDKQVRTLRQRWNEWYAGDAVPAPLLSLRRAKLARVLRFYADKAHRHYLPDEQYEALIKEIDRLVKDGTSYSFNQDSVTDRGWVFCPEHDEEVPLDITPWGLETKIFLFGPAQLSELRTPYDSSNQRGNSRTDVATTPTRQAPPPTQRATTDPSNASSVDIQTTTKETNQTTPPEPELPVEQGETTPESESFCDPKIILGADVYTGQSAKWPLTVRGNPHLLIAGLPGMGKTTCLLNLSVQMLGTDVLPIIFSYHQDIDERLEDYVGSVRYIDYRGLGFNPLQVYDRSSYMPHLDVAGAMRDIFTSIYPELGDVQGERIRSAIKQSFVELGWGDPSADLSSLPVPPFRRFYEILSSEPKPDHGLKTLLARLTELDDYEFFTAPESSQSLWEGDRPTVIRIHTTQNETLQRAFASLVFYGLYKDMFRRGPQTRITHSIIFDEAHRAAKLELLPTMAKECRKYGISLVVASQEARDFHPSLFSAIANYLVLKLTDVDAKALVRNVASSQQEKMLIDKIKHMEKFKALYFREGRKKPLLVALREPQLSDTQRSNNRANAV